MKTEFKKSMIEHNVERHDRNHIFTWFQPKNDIHPARVCAMHSKAKVRDYIIVLTDEDMTSNFYDNDHDWAAWKLLSELGLENEYTLLRTTPNTSDAAYYGGWIYLLMRKTESCE
jgi:hypothetical protein